MERHSTILRQVTNEWVEKVRIHREAARYWDMTRHFAKDKAEEERAAERYENSMNQVKYAQEKLDLCTELRSAL
jgi:hypothetical protein